MTLSFPRPGSMRRVKPPSPLVPPALAAAARRALAEPPAGVDPWFLRYCGDLAFDRGLRTYVRARWQMVSLAGGVRDKVVVDAGSGFGMCANLMAFWGARTVHGVEVHTPMVQSHARILAHAFPTLRNVHVVHGDVSRLPLRTASADLVLSIEAISHYF